MGKKASPFLITIAGIFMTSLIIPWGTVVTSCESRPELFISEYIEGSSNNKALELYNPTEEPIDLGQYTIKASNNGNGWSSTSSGQDQRYMLPLSGALDPGKVFVVASAQADQEILIKADLIAPHHNSGETGSRVMSFNGNDAIGLFRDGVLTDQVGYPHSSSDIDVAGIRGGGKDQTLVRKSRIDKGNTDWAASAGSNASDSEWIVYAMDTYGLLGWHEFLPPEQQPELFLSEYIHGTGNNKAIEVYNPGMYSINLDHYAVKVSQEGHGWGRTAEGHDPGYILPLSGTLGPGEVLVIANGGADPEILDKADIIMNKESGLDGYMVCSFKGNDAVGLFKGDVLIDLIGYPDSPDYFDAAGVEEAGKNHTLVRKVHILRGNTDWEASAGTNPDNSEWIIYPQNTFSHLGQFGSHIPDPGPVVMVLNPYQYVNWNTTPQFKSNLHTHTTHSDGNFHPHEVVDLYYNAGYNILSITDHNLITFPWTDFSSINSSYENRHPEELGMLAVEGNEPSSGHHRGSYIHAVPGNGSDLEATFSTMEEISGLGTFLHPGRYWQIHSNYLPSSLYSIEWYQDYFERYSCIVGLEVFNQGDRYRDDRVLWDELLTRMMPHRPVWGHSGDDMHRPCELFRNYNYHLMEDLNIESFRSSLVLGNTFAVYEPLGNGAPEVPAIDSIVVDRQNREITIHAGKYELIEWISGVEGKGGERTSHVISAGPVFSYDNVSQPYVRAEVSNGAGKILTQAFGFAERKPSEITAIKGDSLLCAGINTFEIAEDFSAEQYHWILPTNAILASGANSNKVEIGFTQVFEDGVLKVFTSNILGQSDTARHSFSITHIEKPVITQAGNLLISSSSGGNQWYNENGPIQGAVSDSLQVNEEGCYYVRVTLNTCVSEPSDCVTFSANTSNEVVPVQDFRVYPNPFDRTLVIDPGNNSESKFLELINPLGETVYREAISGRTLISTSLFPSGI